MCIYIIYVTSTLSWLSHLLCMSVCVCAHVLYVASCYNSITTLSTTAGLVRYRWYHVYMLPHVQTQKLYMLNPVGSTMCSCTPCPVLLVPLLYVPPDGSIDCHTLFEVHPYTPVAGGSLVCTVRAAHGTCVASDCCCLWPQLCCHFDEASAWYVSMVLRHHLPVLW